MAMRESRPVAVVMAMSLFLAATADAQPTPAPPVHLAASVVGSAVTLTWLTSHGAPTRYVVEAGSAPGLADIATIPVPSSATSLTSNGVPPGNYFVRVRAASGSAISAPSNEVILHVGGACQLPAEPAGLVAAVSGTQITLNWTGGGGTFRLEAGSATGRSDIFAGDIGGATTFTATAPAGFYALRVRERNGCGLGPASTEVIVPVGVPDAPEAIASSLIGNTVTLRWTPPAGAPVTNYVVTAGSGPGLSDIATLPLGNPLQMTVPGVPTGTYFLRVQASRGGPAGAPSRELAVTVGPPSPSTDIVTFNDLAANGPAFVTHTEGLTPASSITVAAVSGPWTSGPALLSRNPDRLTPLDSELRVSAAADAPFRFVSARLYSSVTPIPYVIRGRRNGATVYTVSATVPNTFGNYATIAHPFEDVLVDEVFVTVTNPAIPTCPTCNNNPVGIDDIVVRRQ